MPETAFDPAAIAADAVALAELHGGTGHERVRIDWLHRRLKQAPGSRPVTHPLVAAVLRARASIGLPLTTADGSTDANAALAAGIPAVALGCCLGEDMHALAEVLEPYGNPRN
jgi:acetylornithine deacetylase/succinyl-diaminopimelate desuccinylase-like protein